MQAINEYHLNKWQTKTNTMAQKFFIFFAFCIPISLSLENISFFLTFICALISGCWWSYRRQVFSNKVALFVGLLFFLFVVGLFYSDATWGWKLKVLKKESEILCILFLLPLIPYDEKFVIKAMKAFVYGAMLVVVIAWLGYFGLLPNIKQLHHPAPYYVFFKIYAALFMAFAAYLNLYLLRLDWYTSQRYLWLFCFMLISYNVLWQSLSRTGYIIYFLLLVIFCWQHVKFKHTVYAISGIIALFMLLMFSSGNFNQGLTNIVDHEKQALHGQLHTSTGIRTGYLFDSIKLWKQSPIFGLGTGSYRYWSPKIKGITAVGAISTEQHAQTTPENTFYRLLVEHGALGFLVLIVFWLWQLFVGFKMPNKLYKHLSVAFIATMFAASMSQDLLIDESPRLFYILLTCLLYSPLALKKMKLTKKST